MWSKLWNRLWGPSNKKTLADILSSEIGREVLLNERRFVSLDPGVIRRDAVKICTYANTEDYRAFAQEAYLDLIDSIDQLCKPTLTGSEADFVRGRLAQTMALLKISYKAHKKLLERNETQR